MVKWAYFKLVWEKPGLWMIFCDVRENEREYRSEKWAMESHSNYFYILILLNLINYRIYEIEKCKILIFKF